MLHVMGIYLPVEKGHGRAVFGVHRSNQLIFWTV